MNFFRYLYFGREAPTPEPSRVYQKKIGDLKHIWHQTYYRDFGIERLLRLLLASTALLMPGTIFRALVTLAGHNFLLRRTSVELFAILKLVWYVALFKLGLTASDGLIYASCFLTFDTLHYLFCRIFLADRFRGHTSYKRSLMLMIVNFVEMCLFFAAFYAYLDQHLRMLGQVAFNVPKLSGVKAVYFSFITAATVGYGDVHPVAPVVMKMVVVQVAVSLFFAVVYFSSVISNLDKTGVLNQDDFRKGPTL